MVVMNKLTNFVDDCEIMKISEGNRKFEYNMNDKTAKAKLIKGAKREAFEVENNQSSSNLIFSVGSWNHLVLPTIHYWNSNNSLKTCENEGIEVKIVSIKTGRDVMGKHIDTQVIFSVNREKAVCHLYNTTQKILVNGNAYAQLVDHFLRPYFVAKLPIFESQISNYNNLVLETLGSRKVKRADVKYNGGSAFACAKCDVSCKTLSLLEKHKRKTHAINLSVSVSRLVSTSQAAIPRHSTRNNSLDEIILDDNLTITDLTSNNSTKNQALEIVKFTCAECQFKTKEEDRMDIHVKETHGNSTVTDIDMICGECNHRFEVKEDYIAHMKTHDKTVVGEGKVMLMETDLKDEIVKAVSLEKSVKCKTCKMEFEDNHKLEVHKKDVDTSTALLIECVKCKIFFPSAEQFEDHTKTAHLTDLTDHTKTKHNVKCRKCGYEFTTLNDLDQHMEETHGKRANMILSSESTREHACKYCDFEGNSEETIEDHGKTHLNFKCNICEFRAVLSEDLKQHIESTHINVQVQVNKVHVLSCMVCDYKCTLNIQLKKHMEKKHVDEGKYQCNFCDFNTDVLTRMYEHKFSDHPELKIGFTPKNVTSKEYLVNFLAEQNKELMEELITVKKELEKLSEKTNMYHTEAKESIDNLNHKIENTERQNNFPARNTGTHSSPPHTTLRQNDRMKTTKKSVFLSNPKIM